MRHVTNATDAALAALIYGAIMAVVGGLAYLGAAWKCSNVAEMMHVEYSYAPMQGCMVNYHGEWVPLESVRAVAP